MSFHTSGMFEKSINCLIWSKNQRKNMKKCFKEKVNGFWITLKKLFRFVLKPLRDLSVIWFIKKPLSFYPDHYWFTVVIWSNTTLTLTTDWQEKRPLEWLFCFCYRVIWRHRVFYLSLFITLWYIHCYLYNTIWNFNYSVCLSVGRMYVCD